MCKTKKKKKRRLHHAHARSNVGRPRFRGKKILPLPERCRIVYQRISRACTCTPTNPQASRRRESPRWKGCSRSRRREESHSRYDDGIRVSMALWSTFKLATNIYDYVIYELHAYETKLKYQYDFNQHYDININFFLHLVELAFIFM